MKLHPLFWLIMMSQNVVSIAQFPNQELVITKAILSNDTHFACDALPWCGHAGLRSNGTISFLPNIWTGLSEITSDSHALPRTSLQAECSDWVEVDLVVACREISQIDELWFFARSFSGGMFYCRIISTQHSAILEFEISDSSWHKILLRKADFHQTEGAFRDIPEYHIVLAWGKKCPSGESVNLEIEWISIVNFDKIESRLSPDIPIDLPDIIPLRR